jgi:predicted RND superfamily exporter protein
MSNYKVEKYHFSWYVNAIFSFRGVILLLSLLATVFFAYEASFVRPDTRLERLIPSSHEFVKTAKEFLGSENVGSSSTIRVAVAREAGKSIFDYEHLLVLQKISDELSLLDGVNTQSLNSLWSPSMLWFSVTPEGYASGPVIDFENFSDSPESMRAVQTNAMRAGIIGSYVSNDFNASMIDFEVLPISSKTREPLDMTEFSGNLEKVREKYLNEGVSIHIIGDIKKVTDLVDGFGKIALFFLGALLITAVLLFVYSRCVKATITPLVCSLIAVIWQLGALHLLGYDLGIFSVLVPFLVFAIGVSHGVQIINAVAHETSKGENRFDAAKITFHHLHKPGLVALLSDGIGFAMLFVIDIGAIRDLAIVASVGVALVIFTNLVLLPVLMSYVGVTKSCIRHAQTKRESKSFLWDMLGKFVTPPWATFALVFSLTTLCIGLYLGQGLKIGDLDKGAPELRANSRYNVDNKFITSSFSTSTDLMNIFVGTPPGASESYKVMDLLDRLSWDLENTEGVQSVSSPVSNAKQNRFLGNEGNLKMWALPRDERVLSRAISITGFSKTAVMADNMQQINVELSDHRQATLAKVTSKIRAFAEKNDDADVWFRLGEGNAAFEAATNEVITSAQYKVLMYVYGVVFLMVLITFRSLRAVICILAPLVLTSVLANGLMAVLGIGVKVATLPVIALGVGIGVDYGIYIYSRLESYGNLGHDLKLAYSETLKTTGKAVFFTGITLAVGVATWYFSPIKFQADMGILLTFMFVWNMLGSLTLLPALAHFLSRKRAVLKDSVVNIKAEPI